ncbi:uncharacterized protein FOMMEDRAFT_17909, partial [Fomitiporia mediterranea MF3/22]|uniref:uncharacterized protein n=1 Tax=Fomitiporia mediterranea (strain MF3/22) TaxID=694068 RepID=UPI00044094C2
MIAIDIKYNFGTEILVVRSCYHRDGRDLLAIAGEDAVQVLQCGDNAVAPIAYFMVGLRVTSIAWSPRTVSPGASDEWFLELVISTHDFGLYHLTKSYDGKEEVRRFGGGL